MSKLRSVSTHFWNDNFVIDLDPLEKLLFLYLLTNPNTNMLGIYELHVRKIAFETGIDKDMVVKIFDRFTEGGKVKYMDGYVILPNFLKNQSFNTNMETSAIRTWNDLPLNIRKDRFCEPIIKGLKGFTKASEPIAKVEYEYELENEVELEYESESEIEEECASDEKNLLIISDNIFRINGCPVPESLQRTEVVKAYEFFCKYMKENFNRWPTLTTTQMDLHKLAELQHKGNDPVKVIMQTVQGRNKSFYELRNFSKDKNPINADDLEF